MEKKGRKTKRLEDIHMSNGHIVGVPRREKQNKKGHNQRHIQDNFMEFRDMIFLIERSHYFSTPWIQTHLWLGKTVEVSKKRSKEKIPRVSEVGGRGESIHAKNKKSKRLWSSSAEYWILENAAATASRFKR